MFRVTKFIVLVLWLVVLATAWWVVPHAPRYEIPADRARVAVSSDGQTLLTVSASEAEAEAEVDDATAWPSDEGRRLTARAYDARSGRLLREFDVGETGRLVVSRDASRLMIVRGSGELAVWDTTRGVMLSSMPMLWHYGRGGVPAIAVSADGRRLAYPAPATSGPEGNSGIATVVEQQGVRIWDTHTRQELLALADARVPLDISPDGKLLAAATENGSICLWSIDSGELSATFSAPSLPPTRVAFSADAARLASLSDAGRGLRDDRPAEIRVYDVAERRERARVDVPGIDFTNVVFDDSGRLLCGRVYLAGARMCWHVGESTLMPLEAELIAGAISPDGTQLAMTTGELVSMALIAGYQNQHVRIVDTATNATRADLRLALPPDAQVTPLSFSPDGQTLWIHVMCRDTFWRQLVTGRLRDMFQARSTSFEYCGELWAVNLRTQRVRSRLPAATFSVGAAIHWFDEGRWMLSRSEVGDKLYLSAWDVPPRRPVAVLLVLIALTLGTACGIVRAASVPRSAG